MQNRPAITGLATGIVLGILFLILICAGLVITFNQYSYEHQGIAWGADLPIVPEANVLPYGINVDFTDADDTAIDEALALLRQGGYHWLRMPFHWRDVEPTKATFQWAKWDQLVDRSLAHGFKVIAVLDQPPQWARADEDIVTSPPRDYHDYADFVAAFAGRYRGKVDHLQIWDEPNIFPNWGNQPVEPAAYATLLQTTYTRARAANPDCRVLTAALAPNTERGGANMGDIRFLRGMYEAGARGSFDIVAAQPYGMWTGHDDRRVAEDVLNFSRVLGLREIMEEYGDEAVAVWAVEFGWNALPADWSGPRSIWGEVSEQRQAEQTTLALRRAQQEWPWMGVMCLQGFLPWVAEDDPSHGFSVVDRELQPRPVYKAVRSMAESHQTLGVGHHLVADPRLNWQGQWSADAELQTGTPGSSLKVAFSGTALDAVVGESPDGGRLLVTIDGEPPRQLNTEAEEARVIRVSLASGLEDGPHEAELTVINNNVTLGGVVVMREPFLAGYFLVFVALLGAGLLNLLWLNSLLRRSGPLAAAISRRWLWLPAGARDALVVVGLGATVSAACLSADMRLAVPAGIVALVLVWWRLDLGLAVLLFAVPFYFGPFKALIEAERPIISPLEMLILASVLAVILRRLLKREDGPGFHLARLDLAVGLFVVAAAVSLFVAEQPRESLRELRTVVIEPIMLYYVIVATVRERGLARLVQALIIGAVVISLFGLVQYFTTSDVITAEGVRRMKALYGSPNNLSLYLGRIIPIVACLALLSSRSRQRKLYLGALAVLALAMTLTFSIGGWLAMAVVAVFIGLMAGRRVLLGVLGAGAVAIIAAVPLLNVERIASHLDLQGGTTGLRLDIWQAALTMIRDHPLFGVGLDNFLVQYQDYMLPTAWREPDLSHPHNLVLDFWLRVGVAGLVAIIILLAAFFRQAWRLFRQETDPWRRALALGLMASMIDFVAHGMIDNSYFVVDLAVIFWFTMAVVRIMARERVQA